MLRGADAIKRRLLLFVHCLHMIVALITNPELPGIFRKYGFEISITCLGYDTFRQTIHVHCNTFITILFTFIKDTVKGRHGQLWTTKNTVEYSI